MHVHHLRALAVVAIAWASATCWPGIAVAAGPAPDPFEALEDLRRGLASRGAMGATFEQSFVPAGFTSGEVESGTLALDLPACLRWDYAAPQAKSFVLCDLELYSWIPGESSGTLTPLADAEQPGLDLLLLPKARLEALYRASWVGSNDATAEVALEPRDPSTTSIRSATIAFHRELGRLDSLSWSDREGNKTRFLFGGWAPCETCPPFTPPSEITWEVRHAAKH